MISPYAVVESEEIGEGVTIGEFSCIRSGARVGNRVIVHPHVVVESGVEIGDGTEVFSGTIIGKAPNGAGATARNSNFARSTKIGAGCALGPHAVIYFDVQIGENTLVGDGASIREGCRVGKRCILSRNVTVNYNTHIGDRTKIMDLTHITGNCRIGSGVFISIHVSTVNDNVVANQVYDEASMQGPILEDDVIVGAGAILLPGVRLGKGCFVAAGSIVTRDVGANVFVLGAPARPRTSG
jgi:UDP-3-O-[3-hydroxymyristoyl] glucosamine N-acyltransferase